MAEIEVVNPATEETVASVPAATADDVELAVATAKRAFPEWSRTDVEQRAAILAKAADLIHENAKELAGTLTAEQGKPFAEAMREVNHLAHGVRFYAEAATKVRGAYQELPSTMGPSYGHGDPPPDGGVRRDHAVQLPAHAARHQGRPGAGEREHGRGEAGRDDAAGDAAGRAGVRRGGSAGRRAQRGHRPRVGDRRRAGLAPGRAPRRVHGLHRRSGATSPGSRARTSSACRWSSAARTR